MKLTARASGFMDAPFLNKSYVLKAVSLSAIGLLSISSISFAVAILKLFKTSITDLQTAFVAIVVIVLTAVFKVNPIFTVIGGIILGFLVKL